MVAGVHLPSALTTKTIDTITTVVYITLTTGQTLNGP